MQIVTSENLIFFVQGSTVPTRSLLSKLQDAYSDKQLHLWDVAFSADSQQFAVATTHGTFVFSKVGKHGESQKLVLCSVPFCFVLLCCVVLLVCLFIWLCLLFLLFVLLVGGLVLFWIMDCV